MSRVSETVVTKSRKRSGPSAGARWARRWGLGLATHETCPVATQGTFTERQTRKVVPAMAPSWIILWMARPAAPTRRWSPRSAPARGVECWGRSGAVICVPSHRHDHKTSYPQSRSKSRIGRKCARNYGRRQAARAGQRPLIGTTHKQPRGAAGRPAAIIADRALRE
jgi:hypothetical protein